MKLFIKLMIFMLIFAFVGPYLLLGPDGMSKVMAVDDKLFSGLSFSMPTLPTTTEETSLEGRKPDGEQWIQWSQNIPQYGPDQLTKEQLAVLDIQAQDNIYYRWQDHNGVWQFSPVPNRNTLNLVVRTDPTANLLQGLSKEQIDLAFGRSQPASTSNKITEQNPLANGDGLQPTLPVPTTVPVTEIPKLIEQAKEVQNLMDQRVNTLNQVL